MHTFECPDLQDFPTRIIREPLSTYRADTVIQLPKLTPTDTATYQLLQSFEDLLINPTENRLTDLDHSHNLWKILTQIWKAIFGHPLPEIPIEMEPVQLMYQLLTQFITKPSTEMHPVPFAGTTAENILNWLKILTELQYTMSGMIRNSCKSSLST